MWMRIFGARLIEYIKYTAKVTRQNCRLVAKTYRDIDSCNIAKNAPTIQLSPQRVMICFATSVDNTTPFTRYITHTYVHSATALVI